MQYKYLIGIDEAGRGPLAGPVSVGVALVAQDFDWSVLPGVNDSKKLTELKRESIYKQALKLRKEGHLYFAVCNSSALHIDTYGIVPAVNKALSSAVTRVLKNSTVNSTIFPEECMVLLDGGLKASHEFPNQKTIIKGDAKEKVIGLASIVAKVTRDKYMKQIAKKEHYAPYAFEVHKGYGTKAHREHILNFGLSDIHRKSFCRGLLAHMSDV